MRIFSRTALAFSVVALVAASLAIPSAQAVDRKVEIVNNTIFPLMNLYASQPNAPGSRVNYLPTSSRLDAGKSKTFNFDNKSTGAGSCMRDLEFDLTGYKLRNGLLLLPNANVCQLSKIVLDHCGAAGGYCATLTK